MTDFEKATVAAHLTAALVVAHGHLAAEGIPLKAAAKPKRAAY